MHTSRPLEPSDNFSKDNCQKTEPCNALFPALHEVMDSFLQDNIGAQTKKYAAAMGSLSVEFKEHFEKDMLLFSISFSLDPNDASPQLQSETTDVADTSVTD